jgi:NitT/TauT family transport system substrate-binding protein
MMLRRGAFVGAGAAALGAGALASKASADVPRVLRVLCIQTDGIKSLLYAQKANLFTKRGLAVDVQTMASGAAILPALIGGSAEIGAANLFPVFAAYTRGLPVRIIAPASIYSSEHADSLLLVRNDSPLHAPRDLNGKTIGVDSLGDVYTIATRAWVDQGGGDGHTLRPLELPPAQQLSALDTGRVDAGVFKTPFNTVALESGKFRVLGKPLDAIAPLFLLSCWVATVDFIAQNAQAVSGYVATMGEAARYTNAHQSETVDMMAQFTGQDPALVRRSVRSSTAVAATLEQMQRPLDVAYRYGVIPQRFDVSVLLAPGFPLEKRAR